MPTRDKEVIPKMLYSILFLLSILTNLPSNRQMSLLNLHIYLQSFLSSGWKSVCFLHVNSIETYIFFSFNFEVGFSFLPHNNFVKDFNLLSFLLDTSVEIISILLLQNINIICQFIKFEFLLLLKN